MGNRSAATTISTRKARTRARMTCHTRHHQRSQPEEQDEPALVRYDGSGKMNNWFTHSFIVGIAASRRTTTMRMRTLEYENHLPYSLSLSTKLEEEEVGIPVGTGDGFQTRTRACSYIFFSAQGRLGNLGSTPHISNCRIRLKLVFPPLALV